MVDIDKIFEDWDEEEFEETNDFRGLIANELVEVRPLGPPLGIQYVDYFL